MYIIRQINVCQNRRSATETVSVKKAIYIPIIIQSKRKYSLLPTWRNPTNFPHELRTQSLKSQISIVYAMTAECIIYL